MQWFGLINDGTGFLDYFNPGTTIVNFGQDNGSDTPIVADINGDGFVDIGIIRDNGGQLTWEFALTTAGGGLSSSLAASAIFGGTGDIPLIGQFDIIPPNADFDEDDDVDGADFLAWQRGYLTGTTHSQGDANGDGVVDHLDLGIWQGEFGGLSPHATTATVPEPSLLALVAFCLLTLAGSHRTWP